MLSDKEIETALAGLDVPINKYISDLLAITSEKKLAEAAYKIAELTREELDKKTLTASLKGHRVPLWLFNREYTNRGIPPIFRSLFISGIKIPKEDFLWYDLEWLNDRYPNHKPHFRKWGKIFELRIFSHSTAKFICNDMFGEMWRNIRALSLKDEWQVELNVLKRYEHLKTWERLQGNKDVVLMGLRAAHYARNLNMDKNESTTLIQRRHNIWFCGSLANQKPQRTANLYKALTGIEISRQLAVKIMGQVDKDFPDAFRKIDLL